MSHEVVAGTLDRAWLICHSGPLAGTRFPVPGGTTRIGRAPDNDIVLDGPDSAMVSLYHAEICRDGAVLRVRDLGSTNGTWSDGQRIADAQFPAGATIQLGSQGPRFALLMAEDAPPELDRTIEGPVSPGAPPGGPEPLEPEHALLSSAVARARQMRADGVGGQTMSIMRGVIEQALRRGHRKWRRLGFSLAAALLVVTSFAVWKTVALNREKRSIDANIKALEAALQSAKDGTDTDRLIGQLNDYQSQAESLQRMLLYRLGESHEGDTFLTEELRSVMREFGAEEYSIPPDFLERVRHYIERDQGPERPIVARALNQSDGRIRTIKRILIDEQLPPDLAYIPLVEGSLAPGQASAAGAVGPWQFTAVTAKAYGLRIAGGVDERQDLVKSTRATCKYLRDLILDFGSGTSVLLALAAYNSGTSRVKQAVSHTVRDPIKQRNFWYLYRARALPEETREYVPKVFAAILIGRNPRHFGF
jgi:hypothetical protein